MVDMGVKTLAGRIEPSSPHWTATTGGLASAVVPAALPGQTQIGIPGTHTYPALFIPCERPVAPSRNSPELRHRSPMTGRETGPHAMNNAGYGYDALGRRVSKTFNGVTTVYVNNADWQEVPEPLGTEIFYGFKDRSGCSDCYERTGGVFRCVERERGFQRAASERLRRRRIRPRPRAS